MKRAVGVLVALLALAAGVVVYRIRKAVPAVVVVDRPFDQARGPYPVGTREYVWVDSARGEPYTKDTTDRRKLVIQVWYPATGAAGDTAHYLLHPAEFADEKGGKAVAKVLTNSVLNAAIASTDSTYPVLVYNHGGFWTRWSGTFATEWLASHGYVVFSVEHFGFNQTKLFPDGTPYRTDTLAMPKETGDGKKDALASWAHLDNPVFRIWEADTRFTLDRIEEENRNGGPFSGKLDLAKIGMFGWSFGGALSVQMSATDRRVKAAVDHDGQLFGDVRERGTTRPVLQIHHGNDDALEYPEKDRPVVAELLALTASWDSMTRMKSTGDWYQVTIAGTEHGNFSDLPLFYPIKKKDTHPKKAHQIIEAYTLAFFDLYLQGRPTDLLTRATPPFAEATVRAWAGSAAIAAPAR